LNPHIHLTGSSTTGSLASTATATDNIHINNHGMMNDGHATNNNDDKSDPQYGNIAQAIVLPTLCPDGITIRYDNWFLFRDAISEANAIAAEEFLHWNEYLVTNLLTHRPPPLLALITSSIPRRLSSTLVPSSASSKGTRSIPPTNVATLNAPLPSAAIARYVAPGGVAIVAGFVLEVSIVVGWLCLLFVCMR
jgi:hypothetical protein